MNRLPTARSASNSTWLLLAVSVVLTVVLAAPVLMAPSARLFGSELLGYHPDAYIVIEQMEGPAKLNYFTQPATDWVGVLLARLIGGVAAYNLLVLATFPLAAWLTFLLARALGIDRWPSALAALVFAFSPFHVAHAAYHPHISQIQWLPLYLLALWLCLDRWTPVRGFLLAAAAALLVLSNFYAGLIGAVITPVAVVALFSARHGRPSGSNARHLLATAATLSTCAAIGGLYVWRIGGEVVTGSQRFAFPYQDLFRYCARWWSYLVPAVDHPLFGEWTRGVWEQHGIGHGLLEQQVFLGWSILALAGVAMVGYLSGRRHPEAPGLVPALAAVALVAFLFSLPPEGRMSTIPRPTAILYDWLPMFRAYARFGMVVQLTVALLAGIGLSTLINSDRRRSRISAAVLVLVAVVELAPVPPWKWHWVLPTEAHRWVEGQAESMTILDCHTPRPGEAWRLKRMGQRIRLPEGMTSDCGEPGLAGKLAAFGYTHVLVRSDYRLDGHLDEEGMEVAEELSDSRILSVSAAAAPVFIADLGGFSWREIEGEATFRWMGERGDLSLVNATHDPVRIVLELELEAYPEPRNISIQLDGRPLGRLLVPVDPRTFDFGPVALTPGRHAITLVAEEPAAVPHHILRNGDLREITVALWHWAIEPVPAGD